MDKLKLLTIAFIFALTAPAAFAGGGQSASLRAESSYPTITALLNQSYTGKAQTFSTELNKKTSLVGAGQSSSGTPVVTYTENHTLVVRYDETIKPYVISKSEFTSNPNYYYGAMSGTDKDTFLGIVTDTSNANFPEKQLHQLAFPTTTKDEQVITTCIGGKIRVHYKSADGAERYVDIPVDIEIRNCEAYGKGLWEPRGTGWVRK
jgi:hypothetical protein